MASYVTVDTIMLATRAAGDVRGKIDIALLKQAVTRILAVGSTDPKESAICRAVIEGAYGASWVKIVVEVLDINGALPTPSTIPTDAQVDTAVVTAWSYLLASRQIG